MSKKMLIKTLTALAMIAVVVPCIIAGSIPLKILLLAIAALAAHETASLGTQKAHPAMTVLNFVFLAAMMFASRQYYESIIAIYLVILFTIELAFESINTDYVAYTFLLMYLTSIAISCVVYLYTAYPQSAMWYLLYIAFACFGCDTGAYFIGVFFGKHKMIPRISPNKTWEGSIGGYVTGLVLSLLFALLISRLQPDYHLPFGLTAAGSLLMPLTAQIGDLSFSSVKRRFGIKDFGNLFPGHGGVLDRVDSIIFCLITFSGLMILWGV